MAPKRARFGSKRPFWAPLWGFSSQEAGKVRIHQKLEIEVKTQGFVGPLSALDRGYPKCIDFATSFGLSRTVFKVCLLMANVLNVHTI